jgi:type IV secretory pathway VirB4 component
MANPAPTTDKKDKSVRGKKTGKAASTQRFLPFGEIHDNTLVLKNGGVRSILKTSAINFHLKSEDEQNALIYSYQNFLNSLEFPVQIVIRSKKLDIDLYLQHMHEKAEAQDNPLMRKQTFEYIEYIKKLVEYADIMEKSFYVVVPHDPLRAQSPTGFKRFLWSTQPDDSLADIRMRHREFEKLRKTLGQRVSIVKTGLEQCGLRVEELNTHQIVQLFYQIYNPNTARNQKYKDSAGNDLLPF